MNYKDTLAQLIKDKDILILGFGREGQSTYNLLRKYFPDTKLTIADKSSDLKTSQLFKTCKVSHNIIFGDNYLENIDKFNLIIKTPGIPVNKLNNIPPENITSQTDIFLRLFSKQVIGITGTKGKSTTSSLIYHIIKQITDDVVLVGNIGIPPFDMLDKIGENTKIVYELSCHQLSNISVSPHTAALLNLYPEHLDYYRSFEEYKLAKFNITRYQNENDNFIFNGDDKDTIHLINKYYQKLNYYSYSLTGKTDNGCYIENNKIIFKSNNSIEEIYDLDNKRHLIGMHNVLNIMASLIACKLQEIPDDIIVSGINSFKGLKHRLEYLGEVDGVHYYNDSISTIPEATIEALNALKTVDTLILGGFDRGIDYDKLINFLTGSSVSNLIFLGDAGNRILAELKLQTLNLKLQTYLVESLSEAVNIAKTKTIKGRICLLSPAAASYGMFKDFEDRGDTFRRLVVNLKPNV